MSTDRLRLPVNPQPTATPQGYGDLYFDALGNPVVQKPNGEKTVLGSAPGAVSYEEAQTLTDEQKAVARANINAGTAIRYGEENPSSLDLYASLGDEYWQTTAGLFFPVTLHRYAEESWLQILQIDAGGNVTYLNALYVGQDFFAGNGTINNLTTLNQIIQGKQTFGVDRIITVIGTTYSLADSDNGCIIRFTASSPVTVSLGTGRIAGFGCELVQAGAGIITVGGGATLRTQGAVTPTTSGPHSKLIIEHTSEANTYRITRMGMGVAATRQIATSGLATGGGDLQTDRTITVPAATIAEAKTGTSNTAAVTPLGLGEGALAKLFAGLVTMRNWIASSTVNTTGGSSSFSDGTLNLVTTTTAGASALARRAPWPGLAPDHARRVNWQKFRKLAFTISVQSMGVTDVTGVARVILGKNSTDGLGAPVRHAVGVRINSLGDGLGWSLTGVVHNGTTLTEVALTGTFGAGILHIVARVEIEHDGVGNYAWIINGASRGSTAAGPTTAVVSSEVHMQAEAIGNGNAVNVTVSPWIFETIA